MVREERRLPFESGGADRFTGDISFGGIFYLFLAILKTFRVFTFEDVSCMY